jgi:hypothetical protein
MAVGAILGDDGEASRRIEVVGAVGEIPPGALGLVDDMPAVVGDGDGDPEVLCKRFDGRAGDFFEGTVLLRWTPPLDVCVITAPYAGLAGLGAPLDCSECLDDADTFLRTPPYFLTLSAPALALEADLATVVFDLPGIGVVGVPGGVPPF